MVSAKPCWSAEKKVLCRDSPVGASSRIITGPARNVSGPDARPHPLLGIQIGTGALAGGVGTTSAFGPVYEGMGAVGATEIGVSAATVGMILGSLTGGPLAVMLIKRYKLKADPQDGALQAGGSEEKTALDTGKLLGTICMITIIAACGIPIYML